IELSPSPNLNTPVGSNVTVSLGANTSITYCKVTVAGTTFSAAVKNPYDPSFVVHPLLKPRDMNGPAVPPGILGNPAEVIVLWTSANFLGGCDSATLANVTVPIPPRITSNPRLLQLQWNGTTAVWQDITTSVDFQKGTISGGITADYLGNLAVGEADTVPPTVPSNLAATVVSTPQINLSS